VNSVKPLLVAPHLALRILVLATIAVVSDTALSGDESGDTQSRRDWFHGLFQPGTDAPCCDVADCTRTIAEWRRDGWWAVVQGKWRSIPTTTILRAPRSMDGEAYVCAGESKATAAGSSEREIYCFVPPHMTY
jgi:hypothetical protein